MRRPPVRPFVHRRPLPPVWRELVRAAAAGGSVIAWAFTFAMIGG